MVEEFKTINAVLQDAEQYNQQVEVVYYALKYMKENPEIRHFPASQIVTFILKQTWPCKGEI